MFAHVLRVILEKSVKEREAVHSYDPIVFLFRYSFDLGLIHFVAFDTEVYHYYPDEVW